MKQLLLIGAGHAHAQVLRDWIDRPVPGVALRLVSPNALAPYSGMVPGWLAGQYRFDEICIDFAALAAAAGAVLHLGELAGLDPAAQRVRLADGTVLGYDCLSLNVGSTLRPPALPTLARPGAGQGPQGMPLHPQGMPLHPQRMALHPQMLALRPLGDLHRAWQALLDHPALIGSRGAAANAAPAQADAPLHITAVGGGAAGVESLLAVLARLRALQPGRLLTSQLVTRAHRLLPGMAPGAVRAAQAALARAGVQVLTGTAFDAGSSAGPATDLVLWAAGAQAHAWQADSGLAVGGGGFIRIDERLRSVSHPSVLAVGDCADWWPLDGPAGPPRPPRPLPKAGVFAVRMGPVLSHNLRATLMGQPLAQYRPQRRFLALLNTADGHAIASWGALSVQGRWVWRWKDRIDRAFLKRFAVAAQGPARGG